MSGLAELHVPVMLAEVVALLAPALEAPPTDPLRRRALAFSSTRTLWHSAAMPTPCWLPAPKLS